jgi:hypothetical protein
MRGACVNTPKEGEGRHLTPIFEDSTLEDSFEHPETLQEKDRLLGLAQDLANGKISLEDLKSAIKMAVAGKQDGPFDEKSFDERVEQPEDFCGVLEGLEHSTQSKIAQHEHLGKIADEQAASPVVNHNIDTFSRMRPGSNPSSTLIEASILGSLPLFPLSRGS